MSNAPTKSPLAAIVAASLAAIGASVCCVVPLVLVLLGISGAWIANLTALDAWRPWFSAATLARIRFANCGQDWTILSETITSLPAPRVAGESAIVTAAA